MNVTNNKVKGIAFAVAIAIVATGCFKSEAERFGYKGDDILETTNMTFFSVSPTITNWVPERVLSIYERYDFSLDEQKVLETAGVLTPADEFKEFPPEYKRITNEPWFALYTKPVKSFGLDGVAGVLTHFNQDRKIFETSETYFSSYWKTKEEALSALSKIERYLAENCNVKKFHKFQDCWIAEYVRLCVMGVVGQKADGSWSCMIDMRDKCRYGCGVWQPIEEQQARLNRYIYIKELREWKEKVAKLWAENTKLVAKRLEEKGLKGFEKEKVSSWPSDDGGPEMCMVNEECKPLAIGADNTKEIETVWTEGVKQVKDALGVTLGDQIAKKEFGEEGAKKALWWSSMATNNLYEVRLDVDMPASLDKEPEVQEGEDKPSLPAGNWRISFRELKQPEINIPAKPELRK